MKSLFVIAILGILLVSCLSLALAEQDNNRKQGSAGENSVGEVNYSAYNEDTNGILISPNPNSENGLGKKMRIGQMDVDTDSLEVKEERDSNNKSALKATLSNGRKAEIKIMPETASARAIERLGQLNFSIQLKEVGKNSTDTTAAYELQAERHYKILGLFQAKAQVKADVDAETGEVIQVKKPWWAFLATSSD